MQKTSGGKAATSQPYEGVTDWRTLLFQLVRGFIVLFVFLVCWIAVAAHAQSPSVAKTPSGDDAPIPSVRLLEIDEQSQRLTRSFFGRVSARETVELSFEVGGRLIEFSVREGTRLAKGEVVARVDPAIYERAVKRADLSMKQALREQKRAERLAETKVGPIVRAQDAATAADLASVALGDARDNLEDTKLVSPFDALVSRRIGKEFSNITAGQPIVSLHDMSEVRVEIDVPERVFLSVQDPTQIQFVGELPGGETTSLSLAEFEAQTSAIGQSFRVALVIPEDHAEGLIPGASMTVHATQPTELKGTVLPPSAILSSADRRFEVMVFNPTDSNLGIVEKREIELGAPAGTTFRAFGLKDGEQVVSSGAHLLAEGQTVRKYNGLVVEEK